MSADAVAVRNFFSAKHILYKKLLVRVGISISINAHLNITYAYAFSSDPIHFNPNRSDLLETLETRGVVEAATRL